jgi:hypothetical protein
MQSSACVAARYKAWIVFVRLNNAIMGSDPTQSMDVSVYSVSVLDSGLAQADLPSKDLPTVLD